MCQLTSTTSITLPHTQVDAVIARLQCCAQAFGSLVELSKQHQNKTGLLGQVCC